MNAHPKRILSILLTLLMVVSALPLSTGVLTASASATGDIIEFGSYPQTEIKDMDLIMAIYNEVDASNAWISYGYYSGSGTSYNTGIDTRYQSDYMKYADVTKNGEKYRIVWLDELGNRPTFTHCNAHYDYSRNSSRQYTNEYYGNQPYLFKFEPVKWRVLDPDNGLVMAELVLDSQAFCNEVYYTNQYNVEHYYCNPEKTSYANNYEKSSIRTWLNADFYNTAFSAEEKAMITKTELNNTFPPSYGSGNSIYSSGSTNDNVFLLTDSDVHNTAYGFSGGNYDSRIQATGTDYAKSQGLLYNKGTNNMYEGFAVWYLRSPGSSDYHVNYAGTTGQVMNTICFDTSYGVRPAIRIQLPHTHSFDNYVFNNDATCVDDGTETATCSCGETDTRVKANSALGHSFVNYVSNNDATCTSDGTKTAKCVRCDETDTVTDTGSMLSHSFISYVSNNDATCTADGTKTAVCENCPATDTVADIGTALGHSFVNYVSNNDATCTSDGTKTAKCIRCDETETVADTGSMLSHSFVSYVSNNDATCTADGTKTAVCENCPATDTVADIGTALGHSFVNYVSNNDATCTSDGTKTAKCIRCDETETVADTGSMLSHSFISYVSNNDATCTADGTKTAVCESCSATDTVADIGTVLGHSFVNYVSNNDATCTSDGTKTAKCVRCDETNTVIDTGSMRSHSFVSYVSNHDATCTFDGTKTARCENCSATDTVADIGTALGHVDENHDGVCDRCGEGEAHSNCTCICHKTGIMKFFYIIIRFFWKLFGINKTCDCGVAHY